MARQYFGTDGVRGRVGEAPITPDFVMRLGQAAGQVLVEREHLREGQRPAVLIGKDTRISGYMLEAALEAGFIAAGVDVWLAGPVPTPAVAYLTRALRLQAGVVISASHNPYADNGIKFFSAGGNKLPDSVEEAIESHLDQPIHCVAPAGLGRAKRLNDAAARYIEFCKSSFPNDLDLRGMKIALDCAHGAAYHIAPNVFHELGADVVAVGVGPNGININEGVGATCPDSLRRAVLDSGADIGLAFDGDADRLLVCDGDGKTYDGDQILYVIARQRLAEGHKGGIVGTLMSNLAFEHALGRWGVPFARAAVGDRYVLEMLIERGWKVGGEGSGHVICLDKHTTGDGIISALQVLAALRRNGWTMEDACSDLALYPQKLINVRMPKGFDWRSSVAIQEAVQAAEAGLLDRGRVLLRPSGTEPLIRVMVEGSDAPAVDMWAGLIADAVREAGELHQTQAPLAA